MLHDVACQNIGIFWQRFSSKFRLQPSFTNESDQIIWKKSITHKLLEMSLVRNQQMQSQARRILRKIHKKYLPASDSPIDNETAAPADNLMGSNRRK